MVRGEEPRRGRRRPRLHARPPIALRRCCRRAPVLNVTPIRRPSASKQTRRRAVQAKSPAQPATAGSPGASGSFPQLQAGCPNVTIVLRRRDPYQMDAPVGPASWPTRSPSTAFHSSAPWGVPKTRCSPSYQIRRRTSSGVLSHGSRRLPLVQLQTLRTAGAPGRPVVRLQRDHAIELPLAGFGIAEGDRPGRRLNIGDGYTLLNRLRRRSR